MFFWRGTSGPIELWLTDRWLDLSTASIDDSRDEDSVSQQYLRDALDAVLSGQEPAVSETPAVGCTVKWR